MRVCVGRNKMGAVSQGRLLLSLVIFLSSLMLLLELAKAKWARTVAFGVGASAVLIAGTLLGPHQVASQSSKIQPPPQSVDQTRSVSTASATMAEPSYQDPRLVVRRVQSALEQLGFEPGPKDGIIGRQTRRAIKRYQLKIGRKPTGILTLEQRKLLWEAAS